MNQNIQKLYSISRKRKRTIIGLMSGTSLDGLDVAVCDIQGSGRDTNLALRHFETVPYSDNMRAQVKKVFAKKRIDFEHLCLLNGWIAHQHAVIIAGLLDKWGLNKEKIDLIASHGQTVYHAPAHQHKKNWAKNSTLQIGDGDQLSVESGIITISDFRQKQIAAGGEGAPLAVYGDTLLFAEPGKNVLLLNIGGIANFTYLPAKGQMLSTDTGPGNTLMDAWTRKHFPGFHFDEDALFAKKGKVIAALLKELKSQAFFSFPFPKTTGPELFNIQFIEDAIKASKTMRNNKYDIMATLNRFTADTIGDAIVAVAGKKRGLKIMVSGGGMHNPLLIESLRNLLPFAKILSTAEKGINPDAKEAILFALLANETVAGNASAFNGLLNGSPAVCMGKISFPD